MADLQNRLNKKEKKKHKDWNNVGPDIFIKLLGRVAFKKEDIVKIVTFKKGGKSKNYINGYNACDGERSLTEISKIISVTPGTLSPILKGWEEEGIVYKIDGKYKKILPI